MPFAKPVQTSLVLLLIFVIAIHRSAPIASGQCQTKKLTASNGTQDDRFGASVAATESVIVVAATGAMDKAPGTRTVYVYEKVGGVWTESGVLAADNGVASDRFGNSVAVSADTVLVGDNQGALDGVATVYVFEELNGVWEHAGELTGSPFGNFGSSVAVDGDTAIVGASSDQINGSFSGTALVYERVGGVWAPAGQITPSDGGEFDQFGVSVALSGNVAVVGAFRGEVDGVETGTAYVYERIAGAFTFAAKLSADDGADGDKFGSDVAISGETIVVGAAGHDEPVESAGAAYVFEKVKGLWTQTKKLQADESEAVDLFGSSVGVSGDTVVVGVRQDDDLGSASGSAYVFRKTAGAWSRTAKLLPGAGEALDFFGKSIAVGGGTIAVGANGDDDLGDGAGAVYVFALPCDDCNGNGVLDAAETVADGDFNDDGAVDLVDWRALIDCLAGPGEPPNPAASECAAMCLDAFDFNTDGAVDLSDAARLLEK